jgi:hypothetical protein
MNGIIHYKLLFQKPQYVILSIRAPNPGTSVCACTQCTRNAQGLHPSNHLNVQTCRPSSIQHPWLPLIRPCRSLFRDIPYISPLSYPNAYIEVLYPLCHFWSSSSSLDALHFHCCELRLLAHRTCQRAKQLNVTTVHALCHPGHLYLRPRLSNIPLVQAAPRLSSTLLEAQHCDRRIVLLLFLLYIR